MYLKDKYAGVIFESSRREHYNTLNDFIAAILKNPIALVTVPLEEVFYLD